MNEPNYIQIINTKLGINTNSIKNTLKLIDDDNTIHFIARYRKELTGNLDETQLRDIIDQRHKIEALYNSKVTALKNIEEQGKLTPELQKKIENSTTLREVDDLYAPYKRKRKTRADIAIEKGFLPISEILKTDISKKEIENKINTDFKDLLEKNSIEEIIEGSKDIISQEISDNPELKDFVRSYYFKYAIINSEFKDSKNFGKKQEESLHKFKIYEEFSSEIKKIKNYQILALNRGENLEILNVSIEKDDSFLDKFFENYILKTKEELNNDDLVSAIRKGYFKLFLSIENEIRKDLTSRASKEAIKVFQNNLKNLLLLKPHYNKSILGIDPAFRTGCKLCVLDKKALPVTFNKIYLEKPEEGRDIIYKLLNENKIDVIVIGNGTASNETYNFITSLSDIPIVVVNESGASVYSASKIGQDEFPNLDLTNRGTISIARRYVDCLSELVKVPVISIGVGMYQHDMDQKELEKKLTECVEDVVNLVGININAASPYLLEYVSGINKRSAQKIYNNRPYSSREDLKKVVSEKVYQQCVGFLRVPESTNKLDNTAIHPEHYEIINYILKNNENNINIHNLDSFFKNHYENLRKIYENINLDIIKDIIKYYNEYGKELRQYEGNLNFKKTIVIEDLKVDQKIKGIVRNVTSFGAFVDIGTKNDGLIHISQMSNSFVKDPLDIVQVGQELECKIISIDLDKKRIQLSIKED